jgi:hypothetical protein
METLENSDLLRKELKRAEKRVTRDWIFWKPVVYGILTYTEASECGMEDLLDANAAADLKMMGKEPGSR